MVERHTLSYQSVRLIKFLKWRLTRPECHEETEPSKEEDSAVDVEDIEYRNRPGLPVDRIELRSSIQGLQSETHGKTMQGLLKRVTG
jgi:hypothetical protein